MCRQWENSYVDSNQNVFHLHNRRGIDVGHVASVFGTTNINTMGAIGKPLIGPRAWSQAMHGILQKHKRIR